MNNDFQLAIQQQLADTLIQKAAQLPKNFNQTKFVQNCLSALDSIDGIEDVEPATVVKGLMKGAILGLDFMNRECYLIPYKNKDTGKKDVNFQTDYKGEKKLAKLYAVNPIEEISTELVREGDNYKVEVRENKKFVNWEPKRFNDGKIEGAFCVVLYKDGSSVSSEMSKKEMDDVRANYSKAKDSPAWRNRPGEMYKKTVLRLTLKNVEKVFESPEQLRAYEEASEFEFNKNVTPAEAPVIKNIYSEPVRQIEANNSASVPGVAAVAPEHEPITIEAETVTQETKAAAAVEEFYCEDCGKKISWAENQYSDKHFGKALCRGCQDKMRGN